MRFFFFGLLRDTEPGASVPGVVTEGLVEVELSGGEGVEAQAFAPTERAVHDEAPWSFEDWRARDKARALHGHLSVEEADRRWDGALAAGQTLEDMVREVCGTSEQGAKN